MLHRLLIKNMVCHRCVLSVQDIFERLGFNDALVELGEVLLPEKPSEADLERIDIELKKIGFQLIERRSDKIISDIKSAVTDYIQTLDSSHRDNLSVFISKRIPYDYSYLSDLFSSIEGKSIEQHFLLQRVERVKELIVYDQLSFTEIAYQTGFSSVHHLSAQFRKMTGLTPSRFRQIGSSKRKSIDSI